MNNFLKYIAGAAFLLTVSAVQAQQLPVMNHYIYNPYLYNPARTGQEELGSVNVHFKKQWVSMPYSPITAAFSIETPINSKKIGNMGLGGMVYTEQMHIVNKVGGMASYAYHIPFEKGKSYNNRLSAGLSLGVIHQRFDYPSATVADETDMQILTNESSGTAFDFSAGLDYNYRDLHVGFSMLQGLNNGLKFVNVNSNEIAYVNTRHWIVTASYHFTIKPKSDKRYKVYIEPIFMGRIISGLPFQAEFNTIVGVTEIGWLGVGYRSSNNETSTAALDITIGTKIKERFIFAYTFELGVDPKLNASLGTQHEFMLAYRFGKGKKEDEGMVSMKQEIERLKSKDLDLEERIGESVTNTETIITRIDSLKTSMGEQSSANEEERAQMAEQIKIYQDRLNEQNKAMMANRDDIEELKKMLADKPLKYKKVGQVYFDAGSSEISKDIKANLDAVVDAIKGYNKPVKIYLYGSASTDGDAKKNMELSMRRAITVRKYLLVKDANTKTIDIIPMGEDNPMSGDSSKKETQDRRVDIIMTQD